MRRESDTLEKLGKIIRFGGAERDAVHIAVVPAEATIALKPGEHVGRAGDAFGPADRRKCVGIVDPYLTTRVEKGERFWLFLYPATITSLRHHWTHPDFPEATTAEKRSTAEQSESERWLREFAQQNAADYAELIEGAASGEGYCFGDDDGPQHADSADFWFHVEIVTGKHFSPSHRENTYFRCAC